MSEGVYTLVFSFFSFLAKTCLKRPPPYRELSVKTECERIVFLSLGNKKSFITSFLWVKVCVLKWQVEDDYWVFQKKFWVLSKSVSCGVLPTGLIRDRERVSLSLVKHQTLPISMIIETRKIPAETSDFQKWPPARFQNKMIASSVFKKWLSFRKANCFAQKIEEKGERDEKIKLWRKQKLSRKCPTRNRTRYPQQMHLMFSHYWFQSSVPSFLRVLSSFFHVCSFLFLFFFIPLV